MLKDLFSSAAALYDGGWRADDKDWLIEEYDLSEEDADAICKALLSFDTEGENNESQP